MSESAKGDTGHGAAPQTAIVPAAPKQAPGNSMGVTSDLGSATPTQGRGNAVAPAPMNGDGPQAQGAQRAPGAPIVGVAPAPGAAAAAQQQKNASQAAASTAGEYQHTLATCLGVPNVDCRYDPADPDHLLNPGEFMGVVGLILALRALARPAMEFRLRLARITATRMVAALAVAGCCVLIGALLPLWAGGRWPVVGYSIAWEIVAVILTAGGSLYVLYVVFSAGKFSRRNARLYFDATSSIIARADPAALAELADDIRDSIPRVLDACTAYDFAAAERAKQDGRAYEVSDYMRGGFSVLDLWSDPRFCTAMVTRAPGTAIELLNQLSTGDGPTRQGSACVEKIVDQALSQQDSLLYREERFAPLGRARLFTRAIAANYPFVASEFRPLEGWSWENRASANNRQVKKYGDLLLCALEGYFDSGDFGRHPAALHAAFGNLAEMGASRAWGLRHVEDRDIGNNENVKVLSQIGDILEEAVRFVVENEARLPTYPFQPNQYGRDPGPSIYAVLAAAIYKHFESIAQALSHDFVLRIAVIGLWLEVFPIPADQSVARQAIRERLIVRLKDKVGQNLDVKQKWYPAITRLLLSIIGLPRSLDAMPDYPDRPFNRWFLTEVANRYMSIAKVDPDFAKDLLPEGFSLAVAPDRLVLRRIRGDDTELSLAPAAAEAQG